MPVTNMESVNKKKSKTSVSQHRHLLVSIWNVSIGNYKILVEISKNFKNCVVCLEFQCPKYSQIINLAALNVEFCKFG